jgi:hypothetical protein
VGHDSIQIILSTTVGLEIRYRQARLMMSHGGSGCAGLFFTSVLRKEISWSAQPRAH